MGSTFSKLFGGDTKDEKKDAANETVTEQETPSSSENENDNNEPTQAPPSSSEDSQPANETTSGDQQTKNETSTVDKPKILIIKEPIESTNELFVVKELEDEQFEESLKRITHFEKFEREKLRRENAVNALESHVIEAQERLDRKEFASCATDAEKEEILKVSSEISEWIYEDGIDADVEVFEQKLEALKKMTNEVYARHWEHEERPEALKALAGMINGSEGFLATARNITKDPEKSGVFSEKEIDDLEKAIKEVIEWRDKEVAAQNKLARSEPIKLTVKLMTDKMAFLDREVKYLVNKIKMWRPKEKPKEKKKKKEKNETTTTTDSEEPAAIIEETQEEAPTIDGEPAENTTENTEEVKVESEDEKVEQIDPSTPSEAKEEDEHTEL